MTLFLRPDAGCLILQNVIAQTTLLVFIALTLGLEPRQSDLAAGIREQLRAAESSLELAQAELQRSGRMKIDAEEKAERFGRLVEAGLVARNEWRRYERAAREAETLVQLAEEQLAAATEMVRSLQREYELARANKIEAGFFSGTRLISRYYGSTSWTSGQLSELTTDFAAKFGRILPISAMGQTLTHDRFRFDHRDRIDVAVFPDSPEGQWILEYLRARGIPFIAFRASVPGEATGPHIHIGPPSTRL
ncbi:MAG: hypothetical protein HY650_16085 [Acidobacteria bacterium]|nr:hypothetical protein [Acidobacteriota bacterium]